MSVKRMVKEACTKRHQERLSVDWQKVRVKKVLFAVVQVLGFGFR